MQIITGITPGSIAEELQIEKGSVLRKVNGEEIEDIFDYQFLIGDEYVELEIEAPDGEVNLYPIEKEEDEEMGLEFENSLMDEYRHCSNKCIFCFIDQMPKGMRETLYFKDDDSRLSFLQGNYITLTNMKEKDIDRIIRYHMSPINISVHTTDQKLRCEMLHNRFAGRCLSFLDRLYEAGIRMNGQIVLCKDINDKEQLEKTLSDLSRYAPVMESVSIVPVGLTRYREGLYPLKPLEKEDARAVIALTEEFQKRMKKRCGLHFVHASDEFYLLAGKDVPEEERYDGYLQLENGVGMIRLLREEFIRELEKRKKGNRKKKEKSGDFAPLRTVTIVTGKLAESTVNDLVERAEKELSFLPFPKVKIRAIRNDFFGERITVSGLVCGCDIIKQLKGTDPGDEILIPVNMLRSGEQVFLDDVTTAELEKTFGVKVTAVPFGGTALLQAILGEETKTGERQIYEQTDCSDRRTT